MENLIISNPKKLEEIKNNFKKDGLRKIHVLADFDKTLTRAFFDKESIPSVISILRDGNYLTSDYALKAHKLYDKYHAIEIDKDIDKNKKKEMMKEWWKKHFDLLIESGLKKRDIERVALFKKLKFRDGFSELIDFLKDNNIPLVIMSSAGLGKESIFLKLKNEGKLCDNVYIISNDFNWDENGRAISIKEPIIHGANKDETLISDFPEIFEAIKNKPNVILLGDNIEDTGMVDGFDYDNLVKIGFLNYLEDEEINKYIEEYKKVYDVIIPKDGSLEFLNEFLKVVL